MRKFVFLIATFLAANCSLSALQPCCKLPTWPPTWDFELGGGFRQDELHWSITSPKKFGFPRIESDLHWRDLRMWQLYGSATYVSCQNYAVKIYGDWGHIYQGENRDDDFVVTRKDHMHSSGHSSGPGKEKFLFSRSFADAGKGHVWDASAAIGYKFTSSGGRCTIIPYAGFSNHEQHLHMFNGKQVVDVLTPDHVGPINGLNSTYNTRWYGPWGGADFDVRLECNAYFFGGMEWHYAKYRAQGNWNLRQDIAGDFHHRADGHGWVARVGAGWEFFPNWLISVLVDYKSFRTQSGDDRTPIRTAHGIVDVETRLRQVKWHSYSINGLLVYRF